jgi:hypothetical protein
VICKNCRGQIIVNIVGSEVLMVASMKVAVFLFVAPCRAMIALMMEAAGSSEK